jgi:hypothetical protein
MKRAQVKMFETIGVLIVFFFLLGMGLIFYANSQRSTLAQLKSSQFELAAVQAASRAMAMPELDCSYAAVRTSNCFDKRKLAAFATVVQQPDALVAYATMFGFANITVREIYPGTSSWQLFANLPPERQRGNAELVQLPVSLLDPDGEGKAFGILEVRVYGTI